MADLKITLRDCVRCETALNVLSGRALTGAAAYRLSKAARKVRPEIEDYQKGVRGILEQYNAEPDENGRLRLKPDNKDYKKAMKALEAYDEKVLIAKPEASDMITLEGVKQITLDELMAAIPPEKDKDGKVIDGDPVIEAFILEGLHWLIKD